MENRANRIKTNTATKDTKIENTVWLQGVGHTYGIKACELVVGDTTIWNFGSTSEVVGFGKETAKFVTVLLDCDSKTYERRLKKDRIIAITY